MGLVCFVFGVAGASGGEELPGPVLMSLLGDLGLSMSAARSLVGRMGREGALISVRRGRVAHYRLAAPVVAVQARLAAQLQGRRPGWDGAFAGVLFEVPEAHRGFRDRLRRAAGLAGYAVLRPGLLIAPTERWHELAPVMADAPAAGARVLRARIELAAGESARLAGELWDLPALACRYERVLSAAGDAATRAQHDLPRGRAAFAAFAAATLPIYEVIAADPDLPTELLPADWPGPALADGLARALRVFGPVITEYLDGRYRALPDTPADRSSSHNRQ